MVIWVIKIFLYSSSVCSWYVFLVSSASVRSIHFCPLLCPSLHEIFPWYLIFLNFLSHSIVFLYFFARSLRKAFLSLLALLWNFAFKWIYLSFSPLPFASLLFSAICKPSSDSHFAFLHFFFWGWFLVSTKEDQKHRNLKKMWVFNRKK